MDEIRAFFHVKPGHEKAIREGIKKFAEFPGRRLLSTNLKVGAHSQIFMLFDNDTRMLFCVDFDVAWDPYIDDSVGLGGMDRYWMWWSHVEEFANYSPENPPTLAESSIYTT